MFWAEPLRAHLLRLYVILTAALLPFVLWPGIDTAVAGWFHSPGAGFPLDRAPLVRALRDGLWDLSILGFVVILAGLALSFLRPGRIPRRVWECAAGFYLVGPVLLSHELLKTHWHRPRPAELTQFGGFADFTGPLAMPGMCNHNCAFPSGEVSGAAALALVLLLFLPAIRSRGWQSAVLFLAVLIVLSSSLLRMAMGRHFLSDCIFAVLFMFATWSLFVRLLPPEWQPSLTWRRIRATPTPATETQASQTTSTR